MRKAALEKVYELAKSDKRIFFIGSDLGFGVLDKFKQEMPDRFFMEGIAEANIIGVAAGLALEGKIVYVHTLSTFLTRRCFEQLVLDLGLHKANVRLIGAGGGVVYASLGPTHIAFDDIAILRAIPNMAVVAPADAEEMKRLIPQTVDYPGPIYIRLAKGNDPIVTTDNIPFQIGKAIPIKEGKDALIITTGVTLKMALDASTKLAKEGINVSILHIHTIKPLDEEAIQNFALSVPIIVTIEEHSKIGGLGSAVADFIVENKFLNSKQFKRISLPDVFPEGYGSQAEMLKSYSITTENLIKVVKDLREENN